MYIPTVLPMHANSIYYLYVLCMNYPGTVDHAFKCKIELIDICGVDNNNNHYCCATKKTPKLPTQNENSRCCVLHIITYKL